MKFGIKHALVVAIAALCVCVVATGTVLAVTMGNRNVEAGATGNITFRFVDQNNQLIPTPDIMNPSVTVGSWLNSGSMTLHPVVDGSTTAPRGRVFLIDAMWGTGLTAAIVGTSTHTMWELDTELIAGTTSPARPGFQLSAGSLFQWFDVENRVARWNNRLMVLPTGVSGDITITFRIGEQRALTVTQEVDHMFRVVRSEFSAETGTARRNMSVLTVDQGWHMVHGGTETTGIPRPTTRTATFRGWAVSPTGAIVFPVGLPMPVFSNLRIYAIHA